MFDMRYLLNQSFTNRNVTLRLYFYINGTEKLGKSINRTIGRLMCQLEIRPEMIGDLSVDSSRALY